MHKTHTIALVALMILALPYLSLAVNIPFGGMVVFTQPCDEGLLLYVNQPLTGTEPFMWFYGELPFAMFVVPHIGQYLLGQAALAPTVCTVDGLPWGEGFPILFHGSSL